MWCSDHKPIVSKPERNVTENYDYLAVGARVAQHACSRQLVVVLELVEMRVVTVLIAQGGAYSYIAKKSKVEEEEFESKRGKMSMKSIN